jgi:hypothetical protein
LIHFIKEFEIAITSINWRFGRELQNIKGYIRKERGEMHNREDSTSINGCTLKSDSQ